MTEMASQSWQTAQEGLPMAILNGLQLSNLGPFPS